MTQRSDVVGGKGALEFQREVTSIAGWPARITTYRVGARWVCVIDNVDPGAAVSRGRGDTREAAVSQAHESASRRFAATRRQSVG